LSESLARYLLEGGDMRGITSPDAAPELIFQKLHERCVILVRDTLPNPGGISPKALILLDATKDVLHSLALSTKN